VRVLPDAQIAVRPAARLTGLDLILLQKFAYMSGTQRTNVPLRMETKTLGAGIKRRPPPRGH
jgi:hypothetical protein